MRSGCLRDIPPWKVMVFTGMILIRMMAVYFFKGCIKIEKNTFIRKACRPKGPDY